MLPGERVQGSTLFKKRGMGMPEFKYSYREGVRAVIEDTGVFGAWEMGHLAPDMMPDAETRSIAEGLNAAFSYVEVFAEMLRAAVRAAPEDDSVKGVNGFNYVKGVA
jgi:hypothetical protein